VTRKALVLSAVLVASVAACGRKTPAPDSGQANTFTAPTTFPSNHAPVINTLNFAPGFGIMGLTQFSFNASASDPDNDSISYTWDVAGNPFSGTNGTITFVTGGNGVARLTVADSRGATTQDTRTFVVGTMSGGWTVTSGPLVNASFNLTQSATGLVTGSFSLPGIGNGNTDPAQPGRIDGAAQLTMRVKIAPFTDFNMTGTMDSSGRQVSGSLQGSGFTGQPFTMVK